MRSPLLLIIFCFCFHLANTQVFNWSLPFKQDSLRITHPIAGLYDIQSKSRFASWHFKEIPLTLFGTADSVNTIDNGTNGILRSAANNTLKFSIQTRHLSTGLVEITYTVKGASVNKLSISLNYKGIHKFFGGGIQFSKIQLNGYKIPFWVEEQGQGRGDQPVTTFSNLIAGIGGHKFSTGFPNPVILSNKGLLVRILNSERAEIDLRKPGKITIHVYSDLLQIQVGLFSSFNEAYTQVAANQKSLTKLPEWSWGMIAGLQGGIETVNRKIRTLKDAGNVLSAIWIQDWCGKRRTKLGSQLWWRWQPDYTLYPSIENFIDSLRKEDIRVLGYINPFLTDSGMQYREAKSNKYFVQNKKGDDYLFQTPGMNFYLIDLTNPAAYEWYKNIIKRELINRGFSGWMADFGEWLPEDAVLFKGDAKSVHNDYPNLWARLNKEAVSESGKSDEIVFFMRSGYRGTDSLCPMFWMGDQFVNYGKNDGLKAAYNGMISANLSGIPRIHSDIGGYTGIDAGIFKIKRTRRLLLRWAELNIAQPFYRTHEGLRPALNNQIWSDYRTAKLFANVLALRDTILPTLKKEFLKSENEGKPYIKSVTRQTYMVGDNLLFSPILTRQNGRKVNFPEGKWQLINSKMVYSQGTIRVKSKPGNPLVFKRIN